MKKILILIIGIGLIFGLVGIGTQAYFSDVETSSGNIFTAGTWNNSVLRSDGIKPDTVVPVITLLGIDQVNLIIGESYKDAGATAIDNKGIDITADIITTGLPINTASSGTHTITYDVSDKAGNSAIQVTRTINVVADSVTLSSIAITTPADTLTYVVGDFLSIAGLSVTGTYSDGSSAPVKISVSNVSGFDSSVPITGQILTIAFDGKTITYTIDVVAASVTLSSIAITTPATKIIYTVGESLDIIGLVVTGTYSDGGSAPVKISVSNVSGFDSSVPITGQILTIAFDGKTITYTIDVVGN